MIFTIVLPPIKSKIFEPFDGILWQSSNKEHFIAINIIHLPKMSFYVTVSALCLVGFELLQAFLKEARRSLFFNLISQDRLY